MGVLKKVLSWKVFFKVYMYDALVLGALMFQVSAPLGIFMMIQGVFVSGYPIEEESKIGRRIIECATLCAFVIMIFGTVAFSLNLALNVSAFIKGSY